MSSSETGQVATLAPGQMNWKLIVAISGPGGVGKGTHVDLLIKEFVDFTIGQRATTRAPRDSDMIGEYHYFTDPEFEAFWEEGGLLERDAHFGVHYGLLRPKPNSMIVTDIDVDGSRRLFAAEFPRLVRIGVLPPGKTILRQLDVLRDRMMQGGRTSKAIEDRLERAGREIIAIEEDWSKDPNALVVVNDDVADCSQACIDHVRRQLSLHAV